MFDDYAPAIRFNFRFNECNELFFVRNENDFGNEKGKPQNGNAQRLASLTWCNELAQMSNIHYS